MFSLQYKGRIYRGKFTSRAIRYILSDQAARLFPALQRRWLLPIEALPIEQAARDVLPLPSAPIGAELPEPFRKLGISFPRPVRQTHHVYVPKESISGLPINTVVTVHNAGQTAVPEQKIIVTAKGILPQRQTVTLPFIPPYGHADIPLTFKQSEFLTNSVAVITIQISSSSFTKTINLIPFYMNKDVIIGGGIFVILCIILYIIAERSRRIRISRKK